MMMEKPDPTAPTQYASTDGRYQLIVRRALDKDGRYALHYYILPPDNQTAKAQLRNSYLRIEQAIVDKKIEEELKKKFSNTPEKLDHLNEQSAALRPDSLHWEKDGSLRVYEHLASGDMVGSSIRDALNRTKKLVSSGWNTPEDAIILQLKMQCRALAALTRGDHTDIAYPRR